MKNWVVLALKVLAAFFGVASSAYVVNHNILASVFAGLGGVAVYIIKSPLSS